MGGGEKKRGGEHKQKKTEAKEKLKGPARIRAPERWGRKTCLARGGVKKIIWTKERNRGGRNYASALQRGGNGSKGE